MYAFVGFKLWFWERLNVWSFPFAVDKQTGYIAHWYTSIRTTGSDVHVPYLTDQFIYPKICNWGVIFQTELLRLRQASTEIALCICPVTLSPVGFFLARSLASVTSGEDTYWILPLCSWWFCLGKTDILSIYMCVWHKICFQYCWFDVYSVYLPPGSRVSVIRKHSQPIVWFGSDLHSLWQTRFMPPLSHK